MSFPDQLRAIRLGVAWCRGSAATLLRVSGAAAFETLDRVCSAPLSLQDTQLRLTLLLDEEGVVMGDAWVGRDDERYMLAVEGLPPAQLTSWIRRHATGADLQVEVLSETYESFSLHGPWCWDLLGEVLGADLVGMPYLTFARLDDGAFCCRTGKTGEYGYEVWLPKSQTSEVLAELTHKGAEWSLTEVTPAALEHCGLENWFFRMAHEGKAGVTPLELGLQWRLSPKKDFVGASAVKARRSSWKERLTCLTSTHQVQPGSDVRLEGRVVGRVISAVHSEFLGRWVASALVELELAVPGVDAFECDGHPVRSVAPPVLANRSLFVSPQRHAYAERETLTLPPIAP